MSDIEFVNRIKSGDEDAFRQMVEKHQKFVLNTCLRFVQIIEIAEDITQDVFVEVFKSIKNFRGDSKLSTWIYRIAVTRSLDYLKMTKRKKRFAKLKSLLGDDGKEVVLPSSDLMPNSQSENEERIKILTWAMNSLAENQRVAFTLSKYDEMSYKEIADIMETTVSAVESLIHRAKTNLKKKLYKYYERNLI